MPAGVSWPRYLSMFGASVLAMFAGAEFVHQYYRPDLVVFQDSIAFYTHINSCLDNKLIILTFALQTIPETPPKPGELRTELLGLKTRQEASEKH